MKAEQTTKRIRIRKRVKDGTKVSKKTGKHLFQPGQSGNPGGRPGGPNFSNMLRAILNKKKAFRKPDGTVFESTELELITSRAVKELRTAAHFDVKLFQAIMDRIDGKVTEPIDVEGIKEVANDLNSKDIIMSRFGGLILARGTQPDSAEDDAGRGTEAAVRLDPLAKN